MVRHLIYIYKVPESTRRIGYVYSSNKPIYHKDLPNKLTELSEKYELAIHRIATDDSSIDSIIRKDLFFEGIEFFSDLDLFSSELDGLINRPSTSPVEFSKLILSKFPLDKLQIQKVLYLIYAECLSEGIKLFESPPVAFKYGPVFEDVYQEYKYEPRSATISAELSVEKLNALSKTVYGPKVREGTERIINAINGKRSEKLIDVTHAEGGPWEFVYEEGYNNVIHDHIIMERNDKVLAELYK